MTKNAYIVDAYSTGADLPWRLKQHNYNVVHVANDIEAPELLSSLDERYIDQTISLSNFTSTEQFFDSLNLIPPSIVLPGTETGIELADSISDQFSLVGNAKASSLKRRNKTLMQAALKDNNLNHIKSVLAHQEHDAEHIISSVIALPCVVKPEMSAGADDVYFCDTLDEVKEVINKIIGATNQIGGFNTAALIQEMLVGVQYFVNGVSVHGKHYISEVWQDLRLQTEDGRIVSDREILLDGNGEIQNEICDYVKKVLSTLGIENGASHTELMLTKRGPVLIETAARMQGTILPSAVELALGYSQPSIVTESVINPENFETEFIQPYSRKKHLNVVTLISKYEGLIIKSHLDEFLESLESFVGVIHTPKNGDYLNKTVDLFTNPGTIYLCSDNEEQLERDYEQIRSWEAKGCFFDLDF